MIKHSFETISTCDLATTTGGDGNHGLMGTPNGKVGIGVGLQNAATRDRQWPGYEPRNAMGGRWPK